jgi:hypothetical protein
MPLTKHGPTALVLSEDYFNPHVAPRPSLGTVNGSNPADPNLALFHARFFYGVLIHTYARFICWVAGMVTLLGHFSDKNQRYI